MALFFGNNPKEIDLRKLFEKGFKYRGANTAGMPALIVSDADDSDSESDSDLHDPPPAPLSRKVEPKNQVNNDDNDDPPNLTATDTSSEEDSEADNGYK